MKYEWWLLKSERVKKKARMRGFEVKRSSLENNTHTRTTHTHAHTHTRTPRTHARTHTRALCVTETKQSQYWLDEKVCMKFGTILSIRINIHLEALRGRNIESPNPVFNEGESSVSKHVCPYTSISKSSKLMNRISESTLRFTYLNCV